MLSTTALILILGCLACGQQPKSGQLQSSPAPMTTPVTISQLPVGWSKVQTCGLSLSMPQSLKEKKLQPIDSCIGVYEDIETRISLDVIPVGIEEKEFTRRHQYASSREFAVEETSIDGFRAEIVSCLAEETAKLQFITVLDVPEPGLTIWIYSKDKDGPKLANQIAKSVRFDR